MRVVCGTLSARRSRCGHWWGEANEKGMVVGEFGEPKRMTAGAVFLVICGAPLYISGSVPELDVLEHVRLQVLEAAGRNVREDGARPRIPWMVQSAIQTCKDSLPAPRALDARGDAHLRHVLVCALLGGRGRHWGWQQQVTMEDDRRQVGGANCGHGGREAA